MTDHSRNVCCHGNRDENNCKEVLIAKGSFGGAPGGGGYSHTQIDGMCRSTRCPFTVKIIRQGVHF